MPIFHRIQTVPVSYVSRYDRLGRPFNIVSLAEILIDNVSDESAGDGSEVVTFASLDSLKSVLEEKSPAIKTVVFRLYSRGAERIIRLSFDSGNPIKWCAAVENDNGTISFIYLDTTSINFEENGKEYLSQLGDDNTYKNVIEFIIKQNKVDESKLQMLQDLIGSGSEIDIRASTDMINKAIQRYVLLTQLVKINPLIYPSHYYKVCDWNNFISKQRNQLKNQLENNKKQLILDSKNEESSFFSEKAIALSEDAATMNRYIDLMKLLSTNKVNEWFVATFYLRQHQDRQIASDIIAAAEAVPWILLNEDLCKEYSELFGAMARSIESIQTIDNLLNQMITARNCLVLEQEHLLSVLHLAALRLMVFGVIAGIMVPLFQVSFLAIAGKGPWAAASYEVLVVAITVSAGMGGLSGIFAVIAAIDVIKNAIKFYQQGSRICPFGGWDDELINSRPPLVQDLNKTVKQIQEKNNQLLSVSSNRFGFHSETVCHDLNSTTQELNNNNLGVSLGLSILTRNP